MSNEDLSGDECCIAGFFTQRSGERGDFVLPMDGYLLIRFQIFQPRFYFFGFAL